MKKTGMNSRQVSRNETRLLTYAEEGAFLMQTLFIYLFMDKGFITLAYSSRGIEFIVAMVIAWQGRNQSLADHTASTLRKQTYS